MSSCEDISNNLAKYDGGPSIFCNEFPNDQQSQWTDATQYPRISYRIDMQANPERSSVGVLHVDIYTMKDPMVLEKIESMVRERMTNVLLKPSESSPYAFAWARSDAFEVSGTSVIGKDIAFDIHEFTGQVTISPDPVISVMDFLKKEIPDLFLINKDTIDSMYEPSDEHPAIFVRTGQYLKDHETYTLIWINCNVSIHVIAPTPEARVFWVRRLYTLLFKNGKIIMDDGYPMLIREISADNQADFLTKGQLLMKNQFTMLSARVEHERKPELRHVSVSGSFVFNREV